MGDIFGRVLSLTFLRWIPGLCFEMYVKLSMILVVDCEPWYLDLGLIFSIHLRNDTGPIPFKKMVCLTGDWDFLSGEIWETDYLKLWDLVCTAMGIASLRKTSFYYLRVEILVYFILYLYILYLYKYYYAQKERSWFPQKWLRLFSLWRPEQTSRKLTQ